MVLKKISISALGSEFYSHLITSLVKIIIIIIIFINNDDHHRHQTHACIAMIFLINFFIVRAHKTYLTAMKRVSDGRPNYRWRLF